MQHRLLIFGTLLAASMAASAAQNTGGMMSMQDRMQNMDRTLQQAHKTDDGTKHMQLMHEHMQEMRDSMARMNQMMGGREHMMQQMGGMTMGSGGMTGDAGKGAQHGMDMMGGGGSGSTGGKGGMMHQNDQPGSGAPMSPDTMQQHINQMQHRMDMMQMMMDQMIAHQQEYERMPGG